MLLTLPVAFATILFILTVGFLPLVDPDFFWHMKIGELIRLSGSIPSTEVFSYTASGQPWVIQSWISDVVLDYVWQSTGALGIRMLVAVVVVSTWALIYRTVRLYIARPETAVLLSVVGVVLMEPVIVPRPTLTTSLGLALTMFSLLSFRRSGQLRWLLILPPLFGLWPNLHFGYLAGIGIVALFVLSELLARAVPIVREDREPGTLLALGPLAIGLLCLIALGANPYGYDVLRETVEMSLQGATSRVFEWQSPSFADRPGKIIYFAICMFVCVRAFARRSIHWLDLVVPLVLIGAALSAMRHISIMGAVLMPFVARALANWDANVFDKRPHVSRGVGAVANRDLEPRVSSLVNIALVVCVAVGTAIASPSVQRRHAEAGRQWMPVGAADFVVKHDLKGRMFNTYGGGGYLIYRLYPRQRVFIDGRYNPYPRQIIDDFFAIADGGPNWYIKLERYDIDIVLTETQSAFRQLMLLRTEFKLVYEDRDFSVLVRDIERFADLPSKEPS